MKKGATQKQVKPSPPPLPKRPHKMSISRFCEGLGDEELLRYVRVKTKEQSEKLLSEACKDVHWPFEMNDMGEKEAGEVQDIADRVTHEADADDQYFVCSDNDEAATQSVGKERKIPQPASGKRVPKPAQRYIDTEHNESDKPETVDPFYALMLKLHIDVQAKLAPQSDRYVMCRVGLSRIDEDPESADAKIAKPWIDDTQRPFISAYATLNTLYGIITKWMTKFERYQAKIQRDSTFKKVVTSNFETKWHEGDEIWVSNSRIGVVHWPMEVYRETIDTIEFYEPLDWPDQTREIVDLLERRNPDFRLTGVETGREDCWTVLQFPKTDGWEYKLPVVETDILPNSDEDDSDYEEQSDESDDEISSGDDEADPDFEAPESEEEGKRPKKKPLKKKKKSHGPEDVTAEERAILAACLAQIRADAGAAGGAAKSKSTPKGVTGAAGGDTKRKPTPKGVMGAAGGAAKHKSTPKGDVPAGAAGGGAAQSKPKPAQGGAAAGGAAQSKFKPVSAAVTAMRKKIQDNKRKGANTGASAGSAGAAAGPAARPAAPPAARPAARPAAPPAARPAAKRPLVPDSDDDEPLAMRLHKKPKVVSSSESGSDSG